MADAADSKSVQNRVIHADWVSSSAGRAHPFIQSGVSVNAKDTGRKVQVRFLGYPLRMGSRVRAPPDPQRYKKQDS